MSLYYRTLLTQSPSPSIMLYYEYTAGGDPFDVFNNFQIKRRRGGVETTLVNIGMSTVGASGIEYGTDGLLNGDEIRITASSFTGDIGRTSYAAVRLIKTPFIVYDISNSSLGSVRVDVPTISTWYTIDTSFQYQVEASSSS